MQIVSVSPSSLSCCSTVAPIPASTITPTARLSVFRKKRTSLISRITLRSCPDGVSFSFSRVSIYCSARLTFSNSLLRETHLSDRKCNALCELFSANRGAQNGVIVHSDLLLRYLKERFPNLYLVSSTTKVLTRFEDFRRELEREDFRFVVPDFRLNRRFDELSALPQPLKDKTEFLCNECCSFACADRRRCYEAVSRRNLGEPAEHRCASPDAAGGYRFSKAMKNPGFIGVSDIRDTYLPMGFSQFKIEGRSLGSALVLEFLLHYMTKPEYQINVREEIYLDNMLDLF